MQEWSVNSGERRTYLELISAMSPLAPDPLFEMLRELRLREVDRDTPDKRAEVAGYVRTGIEALPALAADLDVPAVVATNTEFRLARTVDWVYFTACRATPGLMDDLVEYEGLDLLRSARERGPVILAGYHFGPNELMIGGIAKRGVPVTIVTSDARERPGRQYYRTMRETSSADVQSVSNGSVGALLRCQRALREGRAVMLFPELSFTMRAEQRIGVPFGGKTAYVPLGTITLAAQAKAAVLPCHVERRGPGRYRCVIGEPFGPGPGLAETLFAHCEELIRGGLAADWEIWPLVPHLLKEPVT